MELFDAIHKRRSIRKYNDKKISIKDLKKIIDAARFAPSACDIQGWRFIVVDDTKLKERLVDEGAASFIRNSPLGILVLYDNRTENIEYQDHIQSASTSIQNMLLAAHSLGLGSCWVCHLPTKNQMRKIFKIPRNYDPIAYITLGYYDKQPKTPQRKHDIEKVISYNKFDFAGETSPRISAKLKLKRILRAIYLRLPRRIKKFLKPLEYKLEVKFNE